MSVSALLRRVQLFATLDKSEIDQLAAICKEKTVGPGELIVQQNTTGSEMYIVAEGAAEVYVEGLDDSRSIVVLGKGQVIGELALIDQGYRSASVKATRAGATLYEIAGAAFFDLCEQNNHIGYVVMKNLAVDISFKLRHRNLANL